MITLDQIYEATDGGKYIYTSIRPDLANHIDPKDPKDKKFKYRTDEKTASAMFCPAKTSSGTSFWRLVDFGGDSLSPFDFYVNERGYGYMPFYEVIKRLAQEFGVGEELSESVNKPIVEYRDARPDEPDYIYEYADTIPAAYLPILGPNVTADTCAQLNWHAVKFLGHRNDKGQMRIEKPTDTYPILMRECKVPGKPSFQKVYKPLNPNKSFRFLYVGNKEKKYICGLEELKAAYEELNKRPFPEDDKDKTELQRIPRVFIMSGERDALCLQSMGEHALWFNSETYHISPDEIAEIYKYAEVIYNVPDIDETGRRKGAELALAYLDVHTIWLPNSLNDFTDNRGRKSKDFRDWMEIHRTRFEFENLVTMALPARFWSIEIDKSGREKVNLNAIKLYHFLRLNGFYTLRDTANNTARLVRVVKNVVCDQFPKDVRRFIREWAEEKCLPLNVRNAFVHNPHMQDVSLENLEEINPCFDDSTETSQIYYFRGKAINVTAEDIKEYNGSSIDSSHFVWERNVLQHSFRKLPPMFHVIQNQDAYGHIEYDIEISATAPSNVFKYLINTSRIHWRKELETRFIEDRHLSHDECEKARKEYHRLNPFRIDGEGLTAEEIREQKINLISKLQGIGYLFHHYKTRLHIWAPLLLDNKIGENGQCNGRSGKSFLVKSISKLLDVLPMDGRNDKLMENNHVFGTVKESTNIISIDDCFERFDFNRFYSLISDDMTVNPKNQAQITIPFERSAKFVFSSNFVPNDQNASSEARRFYMVFSDYYHMKSEENDYLETRTIQTDFGKELHAASYSEEEWNADINFFMQCLQFYLQLCKQDMNIKIVPPMYNIMQRMRRQQMGVNFEEWADAYFAMESGNLDRDIPRSVIFDDFRIHANSGKTSAQKFKKQLEAFCQFADHIECLNPADMHNSGNRILKRDPSRNNGKPEEYFFVRSVICARKIQEQNAQQEIEFPEPSPTPSASSSTAAPAAETECPF